MTGTVSRDKDDFKRPDLLDQALAEITKWGAPLGITAKLGDVARDYKDQDALYAQGREPLAVVNALRLRAGVPTLIGTENEKRVTWTRRSEHIVDLDDNLTDNDKSGAFDFQLFKDGRYLKGETSVEANWYRTAARVVETSVPGLYSGIHFKNPDLDHLQLRPTC